MTSTRKDNTTPGGRSTRKQAATMHSDSGEHGLVLENESERSRKTSKKHTHTFFGTLNVQTLIQVGKLHNLTTELKEQKIKIIALQETRFTDSETAEYNGFRIFKSKTTEKVCRGAPSLGMAFLVDKDVVDSITDVKPVNERLMTMRLKHKNKHYTLVNVHAPTNQDNKKKQQKTDKYWETLENTMAKIPEKDVILLLGDFNAQLGKETKYRKTVGDFPAHKFTNKNGTRLIELCRHFNLKIMSTSLMKKSKKQKTWRSPIYQMGEYQIDHVAISYNNQREIHDVQVRRGANVDSDHYLTRIKIKLTPRRRGKNNSKMIPKFDLKKITEAKLTEKWEETPTENWQEFKDKIINIARQEIPLRKKNKHPWWNSDCENALERRKKAYQIYNSNKTEDTHENFLIERRLANKIIRQNKRKYINEQLSSIEENFKNYNSHEFYKTFAQQIKGYTPQNLCFKKSNGKLALTNKENCQELARYFEQLLNCPKPTETFPKVKSHEKHTESLPPTKEEILIHIKKLKNNKAAGEDGIVAEFLKNLGPNTLHEITQIIQNIWTTEKIPEDWKTALIHPLHKKGDKTNVNNYRGISLLSVTYKILSSCLLRRTQDQLEQKVAEYQAGFRPNRSCTEQIHNLKTILKIKALRSRPITCTFVDFKKAYDSIDRQSLFNTLEEYGLDEKTRKIIEQTLTNTKSKVKFLGEISDEFEIKTGVRQGDGLSPLLFNIALDKVMKEWEKDLKKKGKWNPLKIGQGKKVVNIPYLAFADDIAIMTNTPEEAIEQIETLKENAEKIGLQISFEKTEFIATKTNETKLNTKYGEINRVDYFRYLGEIIEPTGQEKQAQQIRLQKIRRAQAITRNIYNKKSIAVSTKIRHYRTVIEPMALYASETLALNLKGQIEELKKEERKIIRKILGPRKTEEGYRLQSKKTTEKHANIEADIRKRRLKFYGHIQRLPETRLTRQIHEATATLKSTTNWIIQTQKDLQKADIKREEIADRDTFRDKVNRWEVIQEQKEYKPYRPKWSEERKQKFSEVMKKHWEGKRNSERRKK